MTQPSPPHDRESLSSDQNPVTLSGDDSPVRRGSPFAHSASRGDAAVNVTVDPLAWRKADVAFDPEWGVLRAANWASAWVALCGFACLQMFPGGGMAVAALGCVLATIGLLSSRPIAASTLLLVHAGLFFTCYQRLF